MNEKESKSKLGGKTASSECKDDYLSALGVCEKVGLIPKVVDAMYFVGYKAKDLYWKCRYGLQRMFKGYDEVEVFDTYYKFIERYTNIFSDLKKNHVGYPSNMTEKEWEDVIDDMILCLHYMNEDNVVRELEKEVPSDKLLETAARVMQDNKDYFFKLFSKYFYDLWD